MDCKDLGINSSMKSFHKLNLYICRTVKKFFAISLILLYSFAASGLLVQLHYCNGKLADFQLYSTNLSNCCCESEGEAPDNDCCKNEVVSAKLSIDQLTSPKEEWSVSAFAAMLPSDIYTFFENLSLPNFNESQFQNFANAPPGLWQNLPLYKLTQRLVYYS